MNSNPSLPLDSEWVKDRIASSIAVKARLAGSDETLARIMTSALRLTDILLQGGRIFFFGNGGSAADAQHLAAELVGRFYLEREGLAAMALTANSSVVTAVGNDYEYAQIFARQIRALGRAGDAAIGLSTSGMSPNVIRGIRTANEMGMYTVALTGASGGELAGLAAECFCIPSQETPRIQEAHLLIGHILCERIEYELFAPKP